MAAIAACRALDAASRAEARSRNDLANRSLDAASERLSASLTPRTAAAADDEPLVVLRAALRALDGGGWCTTPPLNVSCRREVERSGRETVALMDEPWG